MVNISRAFGHVANAIAKWTGRPPVFISCCVLVILWAASGPLFGFSDTWQLMINTSTTIITFLMVFLIQNTQNRDGAAIQAKLDEMIRASKSENRFIGIEHLSDQELEDILEECERNRPKVVARARARSDKGYKPAPAKASARKPPRRAQPRASAA